MSHAYSTDVLAARLLAFIAGRLPEPRQASTGRPHYANRELLPSVLRVLRCARLAPLPLGPRRTRSCTNCIP